MQKQEEIQEDMTYEELVKELHILHDRLNKNTKSLDSRIEEAIDDHFWDLIR